VDDLKAKFNKVVEKSQKEAVNELSDQMAGLNHVSVNFFFCVISPAFISFSHKHANPREIR
jgi:hypothetical protein